ncbi:nitrite reductase [Rhodococcus sp. X156]|uniref:nitrite reductase n=1 Tax=Rhodococcus sp. X156 TaxID=2499145 RepID=UPI000FDBE585|nr:nitrite reductase [Rhodococcus sp. X156]
MTPVPSRTQLSRTRADRCPGVTRPWPAADGALVRLRLVGGRLSPAQLQAASAVAQTHGDGDLHLTGRANLQLRGLPLADGRLPAAVVAAVERTGLLPSRAHDRVRNLMVSPQTGLAGGRADLRAVAARLDQLICLDPDLAELPGRFLFVLDDGRGDLAARPTDLGLVALDASTAQLRVGSNRWGAIVAIADAPQHLVVLAHEFLRVRGHGADASWHVDELPQPLTATTLPHPQVDVTAGPLGYGPVPGGVHVPAPDGVLSPTLVAELVQLAGDGDLVVTPWRGVLVAGVTR